MNNNNEIKVILLTLKPKKIKFSFANKGTKLKIIEKSNVEKRKKIAAIPNDNPKSPILLTIIAFIAALFA
jgi:hypothetical protein